MLPFQKKILQCVQSDAVNDIALFIFRVTAAGMMVLNHGWHKFSNFAAMAETFPDPLHIGSAKISLALAISGEFIGCSLIVAGLFTRLAAIPAFITMAVAGLIHHQTDELKVKELALLYAVSFLIVAVKGPGRISLDALFKRL